MLITEVIEKADALYPNHYTTRQKLDWCYEVTAQISEEVRKVYKRIQLNKLDDAYYLPADVLIEDVRAVVADGRRLAKTDLRALTDVLPSNAKKVEVIYKQRLDPYRGEEPLTGSFLFTANSVTAPGHDFAVGDLLKVTYNDTTLEINVLEVDGDEIITKDGAFTAGTYPAQIQLVMLDETLCPPPYDGMYMDYVLGKVAYYQNDLEQYNKHMSSFNSKMEAYARWYKQTNPVDKELRFANKW